MRNKKGFTLIELLIVIAIIGILSAALLPTVLNAPARGRDAARLGNMNSIVANLESYNSDQGSYPKGSGCIGSEEVFDDDPTAVVGESLLDEYFPAGNPPSDPSGKREGETIDPGGCLALGQYYYHYYGTVGLAEYVLATNMEITGNNNCDTAADSIDATTTYDGSATYILVK